MKTVSEQAFESFLFAHGLQFEKIREEDSRRPDYKVHAGNDVDLFFEVKELSEDQNFKTGHLEVSSRTVGDHIRKKIQKARQQIQYGAQLGIPSILLIYNDIDPMHLFGTEDHDFIAAMYGAYTVRLNAKTGKVENVFHGRNRSFAEEGKNTS